MGYSPHFYINGIRKTYHHVTYFWNVTKDDTITLRFNSEENKWGECWLTVTVYDNSINPRLVEYPPYVPTGNYFVDQAMNDIPTLREESYMEKFTKSDEDFEFKFNPSFYGRDVAVYVLIHSEEC